MSLHGNEEGDGADAATSSSHVISGISRTGKDRDGISTPYSSGLTENSGSDLFQYNLLCSSCRHRYFFLDRVMVEEATKNARDFCYCEYEYETPREIRYKFSP